MSITAAQFAILGIAAFALTGFINLACKGFSDSFGCDGCAEVWRAKHRQNQCLT
jgi:hypothetical protein